MWNFGFGEVLRAQKDIYILFFWYFQMSSLHEFGGVLGLCYYFISKYRCQVHPCFLPLWREIKLKHLKQKSCPFGVAMSFGASHQLACNQAPGGNQDVLALFLESSQDFIFTGQRILWVSQELLKVLYNYCQWFVFYCILLKKQTCNTNMIWIKSF